jgi:hypothetical protein
MKDDGVKLTFLICGPPKSGTTSLYEYMKEHPDVAMSLGKEPKFFFEKYDKGVEWYYQKYFSHYDGEKAVGEASAENINRRKVPKRLKRHVPNANLIFTLRDPVERLWSHYQHAVNVGYFHPKRKFSELIRDEKNEWINWQKNIGMYLKHLKRYEKYFDRSKMKIMTFREFANDTEK